MTPRAGGRSRWVMLAALALTAMTAGRSVVAATSPLQASAFGGSVASTADLVYMNRVIYSMRVPMAGASPTGRAERALARLRALSPEQLHRTLDNSAAEHEGRRAVAIRLGDVTVLTVFEQDLDPDVGATLEEAAAHATHQLALALAARRALSDPQAVLRGAALSLIGLPFVVLAAWLSRRLLGAMRLRLQRLVRDEAATHRIFGIDWSEFGFRAVTGVMRVVSLTGVAVLAYVWLAHALRQFPATDPLADRMRESIGRLLADAVALAWGWLPDLGALIVIVALTRGTVAAINRLFAGVAAGWIRVPGLHPDTARATRRLAVFGTWGIALAAAYPFIPGSESNVFRGLSVLVGFMFTLGSTGVVAQWMHGLVIVYSRALRVGDHVRVGEHEGVVTELGALSLKVVDSRGHEITVPNAAVVAGAVENHSRGTGAGAVHGSVTLSIGYDVPWRRVHELLQQAAAETQGVRTSPPPRIAQRALGDFSVEYELVVEIAGARRRAEVQSSLRGHIRDTFEQAGVAILSPHFVATTGPVDVPPATIP